jgi:outer membrane protein TolC
MIGALVYARDDVRCVDAYKHLPDVLAAVPRGAPTVMTKSALPISHNSTRRTFLRLFNAALITALLPIALSGLSVQAQEPPAGQNRFGALEIPGPNEDRRRPGVEALTLAAAVDRLERENLTLAAQRLEVVQAHDDVIAARQRANSLFFIFADGARLRLRPWEFSPKRWVRSLSAIVAARVTEALYRDAVRTRTAELYSAYVDLQAAQSEAAFARATLRRCEVLLDKRNGSDLLEKTVVAHAGTGKIRAAAAAAESERAISKARLTLADLLNVPSPQSDRIEAVDELSQDELAVPPLDELIRLAVTVRPDLQAYRLGILRAQAGWLDAMVERWPDFYWVAEQSRGAGAAAVVGARALPRLSGLVVSLPDSDFNSGRIARAAHNVQQSRLELAQAERQVILEVRRAELEYRHSLKAEQNLRDEELTPAKDARDRAFQRSRVGDDDLSGYLDAQGVHNDVVREYVKTAVRRRRAALRLNTAMGKRLLAQPR